MTAIDGTPICLLTVDRLTGFAVAAVEPFSVPPAALALVFGLVFLAGFAAGITVELVNLRARERQLARGRRMLAAQVRGLRQQLNDYYRLREQSSNGQLTFPELPVFDVEEHGS